MSYWLNVATVEPASLYNFPSYCALVAPRRLHSGGLLSICMCRIGGGVVGGFNCLALLM